MTHFAPLTTQDIANNYVADKAALEAQTCKELSLTLSISEVEGRSKATTKAQKVELVLKMVFGYTISTEGGIAQDNAPIASEAPQTAQNVKKSPKTAKTQPTRSKLAKKADLYDWGVINTGNGYAIVHNRATKLNHYMASSRTIGGIATRLNRLIAEYKAARADGGSEIAFYQKYFHDTMPA